MIETKPIGMFDSGIGGLTVMQEVIKKLPQESIIYFGDTARVPYGSKGRETILRYCIENTLFLIEKGVKIIVVACNTATAVAVDHLRSVFKIPIIDVIEPGIEEAIRNTRNQRIAILGTKRTISSEAYQNGIKSRLPSAAVFPVACPMFVPLVEEQFLHHPAAKLIIKEHLASLKDQDIDTVILGCTHYPLLKELIQEEMGSHVQLVDSAVSCAQKVGEVLKTENRLSSSPHATYKCYVSDEPKRYEHFAAQLFETATLSVQAVTLSAYGH